MKKYAILLFLFLLPGFGMGQSLQQLFLNPPQEARPLIIWQWMDGLVTREGITQDLEAFKAAGLAGVQNFQIGGELQGYIGDSTCAIGGRKWAGMMRWTLQECQRLGLSFGTHNCPGWSSSASPAVTPEYSMQKVVFSTVAIAHSKHYSLPRPEVDPAYNYYADIAVLALPADSVVSKSDILDLTPYFDSSTGRLALPASVRRSDAWKRLGKGLIVRFGHTTNGQTNAAQAPASGRGLECDKMRREAVKYFWDSYPQKLIDLAGPLAGTTFTRIEIDSYEAGGQNWSVVLPAEFLRRKGYDLTPFLPAIAGRWQVGDASEAGKFRRDLEDVVTSLFAENYYGYMASLAERTPGMSLLIEPYGTGGQKPFRVLDIYKILKASPHALVATEFWNEPGWGWKDMARHEKAVRDLQRPSLYAEAFTCWPLKAWKDDPSSLKPQCDKAYCTGVNRMMLHAGAANPWPGVEPGMSFGKWGTQFVPGQTWWKAGGAKAFFAYMARCQALLQQGVPARKQLGGVGAFKTYSREVADTTIVFVCNPTASAHADTLRLGAVDGTVEVWDPYALTMTPLPAEALCRQDGVLEVSLEIEPSGSRFVICHPGASYGSPAGLPEQALAGGGRHGQAPLVLRGPWTVTFGEGPSVHADTLFDWKDAPQSDVRYFSGTATYVTTLRCSAAQLRRLRGQGSAWLGLGDVRVMAEVTVNGRRFPLMWKSPYGCDILPALRVGDNEVRVAVTNLWPNKMIGDEQEPDDIEWAAPLRYDYAPGKPVVGQFMKRVPDWLRLGRPRPSQGRKTVGSFKFFTADSPLVSSGLLGPVTLQ